MGASRSRRSRSSMPMAAGCSGPSTTSRWSTFRSGLESCRSGSRACWLGRDRDRSTDRLRVAEWHQISLTYDGSGRAAGLKLYRAGQPLDCDVVHDDLTGDFATSAEVTLGHRVGDRTFRGAIDDLRIYYLARRRRRSRSLPSTTRTGDRVRRQRKADEGGSRARPRVFSDLRRSRRPALAPRRADSPPVAEVRPRSRHSHGDGDGGDGKTQGHLRAGVVITATRPRRCSPVCRPCCHPCRRTRPSICLDACPWLCSIRRSPARVAVNRFWQKYFALGLVKTQEDFGVRGDSAIEPGAARLARDGIHPNGMGCPGAMQRLIVTSATYRQSSKVTPALLEKDPENRLLAAARARDCPPR